MPNTFAAVFAVAAALASCVGCSSCRRWSAGVQPDAKLAAQIPSDAVVVFGIDVERLKTAPFYQRRAAGADIPMLDEAAQRLGVDPRRDISSALVYLTAQHQPVALLRGTFSSDALEQKLIGLGAKRSLGNRSLLQNCGEGILFGGHGVVTVGPISALTVGEQSARGLPRSAYEPLKTLPNSDQLWGLSPQGLGKINFPVDSNIGSALGTIAGYVTGASAGLGVDDGLHLQANLSCVSPKGAEQVRDALRGFLGLGRLMTRSDQADLLRIYDAVHIDQDGELVHVRTDLSPELSDKALAYLGGFRRLENGLQRQLQR